MLTLLPLDVLRIGASSYPIHPVKFKDLHISVNQLLASAQNEFRSSRNDPMPVHIYERPTSCSPRFWIISIHQFMSLRHFVLTVKSTLRQLWLTVYRTHPLCRAVIILKSDFSEDSKHTLKHRFGEKTSSSGLSHHNISAELGRFLLVSGLHKIQLNLFTLRLKRQ